jgi:negative regulator of PHO system
VQVYSHIASPFPLWTAIDLLEKLLKFDPTQRISADEALRHPYFTTSHALQQPGANSGTSSQSNAHAQQQAAAMAQQQAAANMANQQGVYMQQ